MKAAAITRAGFPEVLHVQEVEFLIKVEATSLNRADTVRRKGLYPPPPRASPYPGFECSGNVIYVENSVARWKASYQKNLDSLAIDGSLFIIGFLGGTKTDVNLSCLLVRCLTVQAAGLRNRSPGNKAAIVREVEKHVLPAVGAGKVNPVVHKSFALSEAAEAHRLMERSSHIPRYC